jgi:Protein of unknown function (DUF3429)
MNSSPIPRPALLFGLAGLIPFAGLATGIVFYPEPNLSYFLGWLVQYGALIASFTGALQWGMAVQMRELPEPERWAAFGWSVCPALIAWVALQLPQYSGCYLLALVLVLSWMMDWRFARRHALPVWYMRLRTVLTAGAVLSLGVAGLVLAGHGMH